MNNLAQIIQAIATAVNSRMTATLASRISQMSAMMKQQSGPGWIDKTAAGRAIQDRRISSLGRDVKSAEAAHSQARTEARDSAADWFKETLNPTGRDLAELAKTVESYRLKMEESAKHLDLLTREYDKVRAQAVSLSHSRRASNLSDAIAKQTGVRDDMHARYSVRRQKVTEEQTNPTGMSQADLMSLAQAADAYKARLDDANESLKNLNGEQDSLRRVIDAHLKIREAMSAEDASILQESSTNVNKKSMTRDASQERYNRAIEAYQSEVDNPTGKSQKQLAALADTAAKLRAELERDSEAVKKASEEHDHLAKGIALRARAEKSARERRGEVAGKNTIASRLKRSMRRMGTVFRRRLGHKNRKAFGLNGGLGKGRSQFGSMVSSFVGHVANLFNHKNAKAASKDAKSTAEDAKNSHEAAKDAYKQNPSKDNKEQVDKTAANLKAAQAALKTASRIEGVAGAFAKLAIGIGVVGAAAAAVVGAVSSAIAFINQTQAAGEKEVERFRAQRTRFNAAITSAVMKYDMQSRDLEFRSSQATANSAVGVTQATMKLRESSQGRNEQWEDIGNRILATTVDAATALSDLINSVDLVTPMIQDIIQIGRDILRDFGVRITDIARNTKPSENLQVGLLKAFNAGNVNANKDKRFPPIAPVK